MADFEKTMRENVLIPVRDVGPTSGILTLPMGDIKRTGVIVAHGAGNDMETPLLVAFSEGLAAAGYPTLRFNFLYRERGRKAPDNYETLAETWGSAAAFFREQLTQRIDSWVAAGKSMGGRVASQMIADGLLAAGRVIFLGYPLHSAGNKEKLRDAHFYRINVPTLFFAGTRDPLCDLKRLQPVLSHLTAPWDLHIIDGGDHSFHIPKSAGTSRTEIYDRIIWETVRWLEGEPGYTLT
jgi:predicted alpha/beta-hydrolase family hydrolase